MEVESSMYTMGLRWIESMESEINDGFYEINCMVLDHILNTSIISL